MPKPLSRRAMLRGAGAMLALPFLEAMLPRRASAAAAATKRFVTAFCGTIVGDDTLSNPGAYGALPTTLPTSWAGLATVRDHVSIISNLTIPIYNSGTSPSAPASCLNQPHGVSPATTLAGVTSVDGMPVMVRGQTADQYAAAGLGAGSKLASLQVRTQLLPYTGGNSNIWGIMSAKTTGTAINALPPIVSPAALFKLLFGGGVSTTPGGSPVLARQASVLDLIAADAAKLQGTLGADDKARLDQHFDEVRTLEQSIQSALTGGGGVSGSCGSPGASPTDPPAGPNAFSGWSNETLRGQLMADMIALALSCDLTRVASWMMTFEQVQMGNAVDRATQMHDDSHNAATRPMQIGANANWHATLFARLVGKLAAMPENGGTVLDSTFLSLIFAESKNAHGRSGMRHVVAGVPAKIKAGLHIDGGAQHPGKIQISGLQAIGLPTTTLGELSGALAPIMV